MKKFILTPQPQPTAAPTEAPAPTFVPTPTLIPGGARLNFTLQKRATVCLYPVEADPSGDAGCEWAAKKADGFIMFNGVSKKFDQATFDIGVVADGEYQIFIKTEKFLRKRIPGTKRLAANASTPVEGVRLTNGDITNDNVMNAEDYNAYVSCFGDKAQTPSCLFRSTVDLNDDGKTDTTTDFSDYRILLQNFSVQEGD